MTELGNLDERRASTAHHCSHPHGSVKHKGGEPGCFGWIQALDLAAVRPIQCPVTGELKSGGGDSKPAPHRRLPLAIGCHDSLQTAEYVHHLG